MSDLSITGHKGKIGKEDLRLGRGTFSRATSSGGMQDLTMVGLQTLVGEGAYAIIEGDGVTDRSAEIADKLAQAESRNGALVFGPGTYLKGDQIAIPPSVSVFGLGHAILKCSAAVSRFVTIDESAAFGNRHGIIQNLFIDGNSLADVGLYVGLCVQRLFQRVSVNNCLDAGIVLDMAQNNTFVRCDAEQNGSSGNTLAAGLRLNHGAGNNVFIGIQLRENAYHQLIICDTDDVDDALKTGGFPLGPSGNDFYGGTIEVPVTLKTHTAAIRAGRYNAFNSVAFNGTGQTAAFEIVGISRTDAATSNCMFTNCDFLGTAAFTRAIRVTDAPFTVVDGGFFENHLYAFAANDPVTTPSIYVSPRTSIGASVANRFEQLGAATEDDVVSRGDSLFKDIQRNSYRITRAGASDYVFEASVSGDAVRRYRINAIGSAEWGNGADAPDATLYRSLLLTDQTVLRHSVPVAVSNQQNAIYAGSGSPESVVKANIGSIYMRTDGGTGTAAYVKVSGAGTTGWKAINNAA